MLGVEWLVCLFVVIAVLGAFIVFGCGLMLTVVCWLVVLLSFDELRLIVLFDSWSRHLLVFHCWMIWFVVIWLGKIACVTYVMVACCLIARVLFAWVYL